MTNRRMVLGLAAGAAAGLAWPAAARPRARVWTFDRLDRIGGLPVEVSGAPKLVRSPFGKAVEFDGVDDALFIPEHPLAGAKTFTMEAVFRPDGGAFEQRWLHLATDEPPGGPGTRMLFEIRVVEGGWYLDTFVKGAGYSQTLVFPEKLHPLGRWHHVAQVCDGRTYACFVDGVLQGQAQIAFQPQGPGRSSVGVRINRVNWFRGAVREARFTPQALAPSAFRRPRPT